MEASDDASDTCDPCRVNQPGKGLKALTVQGGRIMNSRVIVNRSGWVWIAGVLLILGFTASCAGPYYEPGPRYGPGPRGHWLSSSEVRHAAEQAVYRYFYDREGPGSRPQVKAVRILGVDRDEAEVTGRVSFRRGVHPFQRGNALFRCRVDRRNGGVHGLDFN
jgi:hypothetical protein